MEYFRLLHDIANAEELSATSKPNDAMINEGYEKAIGYGIY